MNHAAAVLLGAGLGLVSAMGVAVRAAAPVAEPPAAEPPADLEVLGGRNTWRFLICHRPYDESGPRTPVFKAGRWVRWGEELWSPLPDENWADPDFDDSGWPRQPGPFLGGYGSSRRPGAALVYVRGRFAVTDPARATGVRLAMAYRGGVVVYLNGKEIARGHLPAGPIAALTPAEAYPKEAFLTPDGQALLPEVPSRAKPAPNLLERYNLRLRRLARDVPPGALRQGTNVLAIELHRSPVPPETAGLRGAPWDTVGLVGLRMTVPASVGPAAVVPNVPPEQGVHVWNADPLLRVGVDVTGPDPLEPLGPIDLVAPVNGIASGQVAVSAAEELKGVSARAGDLESPEGGTIPASAIRVRYAKPGDGYVALFDRPVDSAALQSVWVTVKVPPEARAGVYTGSLAVRGAATGGGDVTVPVRLRVHGWKVGDPRAWRTVVNLLQSPESVAGHYGVPLWSDRHFQLLEKSLALMGEAGNDVLGVSAVAKTVFGDDPLIVFRKVGPGPADWEPQFQFLDRYLALYQKHAGEPTFLCLQVWHYGMSFRGRGRDGAPRGADPKPSLAETIPIVELNGDQLRGVEMPMYGAAGTQEVWRQVLDGLAERVRRLSWRRECILLGTSGDNWPNEPIVAFFKAIAPWAEWRAITHGSGVPNWGASVEERTQPNGMVVRYLEYARRISTGREPPPGCYIAGNARDCCGPDPFCYRSLPACSIVSANYDGFAWKGLDYWTYATPEGAQRSALNYYVHFGNIVGSTPRTLAMPGPDGAVATVQFEALREGTQDAEAVLFIREALTEEGRRRRLGEDLARRAQAAVDDLVSQLELGLRISPQGGYDMRRLTDRLHAAAAAVAAVPGGAE